MDNSQNFNIQLQEFIKDDFYHYPEDELNEYTNF